MFTMLMTVTFPRSGGRTQSHRNSGYLLSLIHIYSKEPGSAAAPTAGLHFTKELLARIADRGVRECFVTLHVGLGTFRPVKAEDIEEHEMHSEFCIMPEETARIITETKRSGGRVVCVGTTSCRTVESFANEDGTMDAKSGWTNIFIYPGYRFKCMDCLLYTSRCV